MAIQGPVSAVALKKSDMEDESLGLLNQNLNGIIRRLNELSGHAGPIKLQNSLDLGGQPIKNVGAASDPDDVVTVSVGNKNYGIEAIQPALEATGNKILQTTRRLNDTQQRENFSSFLNGVMNTAPTTNNSLVSAAAASGGSVAITVSAGYHSYVDGKTITPYAQRTDTVALPESVSITTLTRTSGVVTAVLASALSPLAPGGTVNISGASDSSFDGAFIVISISGTTITWKQVAPNGSATGGTAALAGVYYYYIRKNTKTLALAGPYTSDSQQNRTEVNIDGQVLIAVAYVNQSGLDYTQSAGGATPPAQTNNSYVLHRV